MVTWITATGKPSILKIAMTLLIHAIICQATLMIIYLQSTTDIATIFAFIISKSANDGTGLGTFIGVTHFSVESSTATNPARSGLAIINCAYFMVDKSFIKKDRPSNSEVHGVYIENSHDAYL